MTDNIYENYDRLKKNDLPAPNDFTIEIGKLIRAAREAQGLTQTALAEKLSRSQVTISEIENGKVDISFLTLMLLCITLQKPISYFVPEFVLKNLIVEAG